MKSGIPFPQNKGYSTEVGKENWFLTKAKGKVLVVLYNWYCPRPNGKYSHFNLCQQIGDLFQQRNLIYLLHTDERMLFAVFPSMEIQHLCTDHTNLVG